MKYVYPAIFTKEEKGYSIAFPDIEGANTCGDDLEDALEMAEDVLSLMLVDMENNNENIPTASAVKDIKTGSDEFVTLIRCDTDRYRRLLNSRAVKKTLSIPEWLNESATAAGINFSQVLQDALKRELNITK